VREQCIVRGV